VALRLQQSELARAQIDEIRAKAKASPTSAHGKYWDALEGLLKGVVVSEDHAFSSATALGRRHSVNLSGVRRAKMGRTRVFFLASRERQLSIVLMIGFRKEGDQHDAYAELKKRIRRGEFDAQFLEAGIKKPDV
jgi:hypothetical protein